MWFLPDFRQVYDPFKLNMDKNRERHFNCCGTPKVGFLYFPSFSEFFDSTLSKMRALPSYSVKPQNQEISGFNKHFYLVNFCQTEPDWDEQSSHFMQNSLQRVWQAKHPACPNIKACPPLSTMMVNLPCLWGSVSQLPSSHLFIHRVPAKLLRGV